MGNLPPALNTWLRTGDFPITFGHLRLVKYSVTGATARIIAQSSYRAKGDTGTPSWPAGGGAARPPTKEIIPRHEETHVSS
jgi:hypothetical protein